MVRWPEKILPTLLAARLAALQTAIDGVGAYPVRVVEAKIAWRSKNKRLFDEVRAILATMCSGAQRCAYCEDSAADEIEHLYPKDLYPERVFMWANYVFACGPCNGPKNSKFAVISGADLVDVSRRRGDPIVPPPTGGCALLNPRIEDPMDSLAIDLETFVVSEKSDLGELSKARAGYTIRLLTLNRDYLLRAREEAFNSYSAKLEKYVAYKKAARPAAQLEAIVETIKSAAHPAIWLEMKRSGASQVPYLSDFFEEAPESLLW